MVAKMENRQSFIQTKDLEIAAKQAMGESADSRIAKRSKQGLKEFYDAINTPLGEKAQSYDTMRRNTAVSGYKPKETPQTHHKEGQKKYGQSRGNAVLRSNNPWQILIQETVERTRRGLSGGNLDFNAAMLIPEFHQGVSQGSLANQGVHQFVDRIPLDGSATPEERIEQSAYEQRAADDWAGKDGVVITDKGIESGVTRSSMLETMRKEGIVDPSNQREVLGQLGEITTTDQFKNVAEEFNLPYTETSIPPFKGFQYRMGLAGFGPELGKFLKQRMGPGALFGATQDPTLIDKGFDALESGDVKAGKEATRRFGTNLLTGMAADEALRRAPAAFGRVAGGAGLAGLALEGREGSATDRLLKRGGKYIGMNQNRPAWAEVSEKVPMPTEDQKPAHVQAVEDSLDWAGQQFGNLINRAKEASQYITLSGFSGF